MIFLNLIIIIFFFLSCQVGFYLVCIVGELGGGGFVAVADAVNDR